jgi:hypothetical protein
VLLIVAIVVAAVIAAGSHAAKSTAEREFEHLDLFGAWAPNCAEAASPDNPHVVVVRGDKGYVIEQNEFGAGYEINRYLIVAARHISGHRLAIDALFQQDDNEPQQQLIVIEFGREGGKRTRHTVFTGTGNGPPLVKDGVAVAVGKPTPVLNKCD